MSSMSSAPRDAEAGGPGTPLDTRGRIAAAAFELFADRGYEGTTVDAIAERAGIARRTFFRYFRSKDDVIFPDHDTLLGDVRRYLQAADESSPVEAVCGGVRLVFRSYVDDPGVSLRRYLLTRSVTPLRDREIASVRRYERAFSKYLYDRFLDGLGESAALLRADVIAASVVSAHNAVLREWLRSGGTPDPFPRLEQAFSWVAATFEQGPALRPAAAPPAVTAEPAPNPAPANGSETPAEGGDVVVAVFRADQSIDDIVQRITRSL
jgi:AcrR family transcriptional regulator